MRKVRIQRKRRPWLWKETKRLFAFGDLCTRLLVPIARYGGALQKEALETVKIENRRMDTQLKATRESYVIAQAQRLELLNIEKRLELEARFPGKVAPMLGESQTSGIAEWEKIPHCTDV